MYDWDAGRLQQHAPVVALARIHRSGVVMLARGMMGVGTRRFRFGPNKCGRWRPGCSNGGPQWRRWARLADQAARDTRGPARREFAGMFDCPDGEACGGGRSSWEWNCSAGPGRDELVLPGPALGKMQGEAACRAGEPSGEREEQGSWWWPSPLPDRCALPSGPGYQHLHRQPGACGGEAARGEMVQTDAVLGSRMAFSTSAWRRWSASSSRVSPSRSVMKPDSCRWRRGPAGSRASASPAGR